MVLNVRFRTILQIKPEFCPRPKIGPKSKTEVNLNLV